MAVFLSFPPPQPPLLRRRFSHPFAEIKSPGDASLFRCSSSVRAPGPSGVSVDEPSASSLPEAVPNDGEFSEGEEKLPLSSRGCTTCGRDEIEKGCNGEGRIQGGIATVPGFGWWPIKAYRPCPGFVASGGRYRRRGQSMDEVAFGRGKSEGSIGSTDKVRASKKVQDPRN